MNKRYHILDTSKKTCESNIPTQAQAQTVINFLCEQNPGETYTIQEEEIHTVKGLGRDPDLH